MLADVQTSSLKSGAINAMKVDDIDNTVPLYSYMSYRYNWIYSVYIYIDRSLVNDNLSSTHSPVTGGSDLCTACGDLANLQPALRWGTFTFNMYWFLLIHSALETL